MKMGDAEMVGLNTTLIELDLGTQVQDRAHIEFAQFLQFLGVHSVQRIGAEQGAPSHGLSGTGAIAAEVTEVECSAEMDLAIGVIGSCVVEGVGHDVEARGECRVHHKALRPVALRRIPEDCGCWAREQQVFTVIGW